MKALIYLQLVSYWLGKTTERIRFHLADSPCKTVSDGEITVLRTGIVAGAGRSRGEIEISACARFSHLFSIYSGDKMYNNYYLHHHHQVHLTRALLHFLVRLSLIHCFKLSK